MNRYARIMSRGRPSSFVLRACLPILLILAWLAVQGRARVAGEDAIRAGEEPILTKEEAKVLDTARTLAETDPERAVAHLRRALRRDSSPALDFAIGCYLIDDEESGEALEAFRRALEKMPGFRRARWNLATLLVRERKHEDAVPELLKLLENGDDPRHAELLELLGHAYLETGRLLPAETALKRALLHRPDDRNLSLMMIEALTRQEKHAEARFLADRAIVRSPLEEEFWKLAANIDLATDRKPEARARLECAARLGIASARTLVTLGDLYLEAGMVEEAYLRFERTAAMEDAPISRLLRASGGLLALGELKRARDLLKTLEPRAGTMTEAQDIRRRHLAARLLDLEGDLENAARGYEALLRDHPLEAETLMAAGYALQRLDRLDEALRCYARAARIDPDREALSLVRQAQIAVLREAYDDAVKMLERALELDRRDYIATYLEQVRRVSRTLKLK